MAKKKKQCKGLAWIALIVGVLYLLQDLAVISFWNISWYTVGFILAGLYFIMNPKK
ncbi:hypothetical protein GF361_01730 [Candidatus Woesearchaeota archaeon]|nr:hypothetical protein [Candidatus Woesearchaeota archaeon]